jgi:hypothetical protein
VVETEEVITCEKDIIRKKMKKILSVKMDKGQVYTQIKR